MPLPRFFLPGAIVALACAAGFALFRARNVDDPPPVAPVESLHESTSRLGNGLAVDLDPCDSCENVAVVLQIGIGAEHDPEGRSGLGFMLGQLLQPMPDGATPAGAPRSLSVEAETMRYSSVVAPSALGAELGRAALLMTKLDLDAGAVERARGNVTQQIQQRQGEDAVLTAQGFAKESVRTSRARGYLGGTAEEVAKVTPSELESHWQTYVRPTNARLAIAGKLEPSAVTTLVEKLFGGVPSGKRAELGPPSGAAVTGTLVMGATPTALAFAVAAPGSDEATFPGFLVLATRVATGTGAWRVDYDPLLRPGALLVSGTLSGGERPEPAAERLRAELDAKLAPPLRPADLEAVRARFGIALGLTPADPAACRKDPLSVALGYAGRGALGIDAKALSGALSSLTEEKLTEARSAFAKGRTSAVGAGGQIR